MTYLPRRKNSHCGCSWNIRRLMTPWISWAIPSLALKLRLWGKTSGEMNILCCVIRTRIFGLTETPNRVLRRFSDLQFGILLTSGARVYHEGWTARCLEHSNAATRVVSQTAFVLSAPDAVNDRCYQEWPILFPLIYSFESAKDLLLNFSGLGMGLYSDILRGNFSFTNYLLIFLYKFRTWWKFVKFKITLKYIWKTIGRTILLISQCTITNIIPST